jgi:hypothetical protein
MGEHQGETESSCQEEIWMMDGYAHNEMVEGTTLTHITKHNVKFPVKAHLCATFSQFV